MEAEIRILSIGNFGYGWDGSICDEEHIASALEELGHTVTRIQREDTQIPGWKFLAGHDFILIQQWDGYDANLVHRLKNVLNGPIVYWAFDYQADGQEWHKRLVAESDLYLSKRIADSEYPNWQWLSQDFSPSFLDRHNPAGKKYRDRKIDVLFTGSYLPWATERNETIKAVNEKFNLVVHSVNSWPEEYGLDVRSPVMDEGLPELYQNAKIVLAIDHTLEAGYWSDRSAQAMCCGSFVMQRYVPMMETHFPGMTFFYSIQNCLQKIESYLTPEGAARMIWNSSQDYEYAQAHLKVKNRVQDLLTIVEGIL